MPTDFAFRLSTYLTLALSCVCLGYAERKFLPEVPFLATAVIISLVVLFRLETRIRLLTIPDANRVGLVLGLVFLVWAVVRVVRVLRETGRPEMEWQMLLIALVGPLLLVTIPAKLARREKHVGDYWWFQGVALAAVGLSGAMTDDAISFILIGLYAVCAVWSLQLLYLRRAAGKVPGIPGHPDGVRVVGVVAEQRPRVGLTGGLILLGIGIALAVPLYLLTPRSTFTKLEFGKSRVRIGYAADQMLDLNQTGELAADDQIAFHVKVERDGVPEHALSTDQRWRGRVMRRYVDGGWNLGESELPTVEAALPLHVVWTGQITQLLDPIWSVAAFRAGHTVPRRPREWTTPRLWHDQLSLTYVVPRDLSGEFLAEPIVWVPGAHTPIATMTHTGLDGWHWLGDGSFYGDFTQVPADEHTIRYVQIWDQHATPDHSPPLRLVDRNPFSRLTPLLQYPVPRMRDYSSAVIDQMIATGQLPANCRDPISLLPRRQFHSQVAHAFTLHLATTPELQYTTNLRRERKDLDPVEDFLFHTKAGHCERFASALVLMLRSQGIPAVLVLGFKGCEATAEPGEYIVRQQFAHAWVDALVPTPGQSSNIDPRDCVYHWVSLDPTPGDATTRQAVGESGRLGEVRSWLRSVYDDYVVNYSPEKRRRALRAIANWFSRPEVLAVLGAVVVVVAARRRLVRRAKDDSLLPTSDRPESQWFANLLKVLATYGFTPGASQTAREFAAAVAESLRQRPGTAGVAEVPLEWADAYYEARFGGETLSPQTLVTLKQRLTQLETVLATSRANSTSRSTK